MRRDHFDPAARSRVNPPLAKADKQVLTALGPLFDEHFCPALKASLGPRLCVYPTNVSAQRGVFIKTLRLDLGSEPTQSFSTSLGSDRRNLHRRMDAVLAVRSQLVSVDVMLEPGRIRRLGDSEASALLGFEAPRRTGLWELNCGPSRMFVDPVTLIERLVAPGAKMLTLLLSPLLNGTYEVAVSEGEFRFRSDRATTGEVVELLSDQFPVATYERARCLAYWLGSVGRGDALRTFLGQLLDPDAQLAMPSMFGKVPFRLTCIVEKGRYFVLQMDSMLRGAQWPLLFDRLIIEDRDSGDSVQFMERHGPPATLAWWGPQEVDFGTVACKVIGSAMYDRASRRSGRPPPPSEGTFWPTTVRQGANRSLLLLDGRFCKGHTRQGPLPFEQPIRSLAPLGLSLDHSDRVLQLLQSTPPHAEICARLKQLVPELFGCLPVHLPRDAVVRDLRYKRESRDRARLVRGLVRLAGGRNWVGPLARKAGVEELAALIWSEQIGRSNLKVEDFYAHPDIAYVDPLAYEEDWSPEMIDALRALGHRGTKAYGFSRNLWTERQYAMLAQAVGFPPISEEAGKLSSRRAAPFLSDAELRKLLDLATG